MFAFIRSMPNIVDRLLDHIEVPPVVDLLIRIIQLDDLPTGAGVLEVRPPPLYLYPSQTRIYSGYPRKTSWAS